MLICSSWVASQSLPANSSKMAAWGGGAPPTKGRPSRAPEKQCQKRPHATSKAPKQVPRAVSPAAENGGRALRRLVPLAGRGVGPRQAPRASALPVLPWKSSDLQRRPFRPLGPAASDEALLCAEAGASSPEEHGRRPGEAEGLTLLVKGFSGAGHPPLGPVPVQIAVLTATTTTAVRRRETENVRYF